MSLDDSFSIRIKKKNGSWYWLHNVIGLVQISDYSEVISIVKDLKYKQPVVCVYNETRGHLSEIYINGLCERFRKETI